MLRPGPGTPPEQVTRNQRGRLFGAMVASVAERGYSATRVEDLVELSGVSRSTFYVLFPDKEACFLATIEELLAGALGATAEIRPGTWEKRALDAGDKFAELIVDQPAAARLCLIEAHSAGPEVLEAIEKAAAKFESLLAQIISESPERAGMPVEMLSACVGAIQEIARDRLRRGREAELPRLIRGVSTLMLSYQPPPEPLRLSTRPPTPAPETLDAPGHAERALRALAFIAAEHGYANTTVNQVVKRASMSPTTFYANFSGKEDALLAAIDSAGAQMMAAILPAFHRNPDWPLGVRAALGDLFNFLASRPALARLVMVEVYAAGPAAMEHRAETVRPLEELIAEGRRRSPEIPAIALEAIAGGIYSLAYKQIRESGPESLPGLAPICTYIALAPFIGAEEACVVANGDGRARGSQQRSESIRAVSVRPLRQRALSVLSDRAATLEEISEALGEPLEEVRHEVEELVGAGLIEAAEERRAGDLVERVYQSNMGVISDSQWARFSLTERHRISAQIGDLVKGDAETAAEAGTFDARIDRHLVRVPFIVDEQGWDELSSAYTEMENTMFDVQAKSSERIKRSEEEGIHVRGVLALFEMPAPD